MANKIRSIELEGGVIVNFQDKGIIELIGPDIHKVKIHSDDLETIRDTAKKNSKSNGFSVDSSGKTLVNTGS